MTVTEIQQARNVQVSELLGAGTVGAWIVYGVFAASLTTLAFLTFDHVHVPAISVAALAILLAAATLLVRHAADPLPAFWTWIVLASGVAATAMVSWNVILNDGPGRERWYNFGFTWMLFILAMRGRPFAAWVGLAAMVGTHALWAATTGVDVVGEMVPYQTSAAIVVVAILATRALRRSSARINSLRQRSVELAAAAAEVKAAGLVRRERVDELRRVAEPLLNRIVHSGKTSDGDRIDYLMAEAAIRDAVRGRSLMSPVIKRATLDARLRGVEVTLLDDRGEPLPDPAAMRLIEARAEEVLRHAHEGSVTVRLAPRGRRAAASVVTHLNGVASRLEFNENGEELEPLQSGKSG